MKKIFDNTEIALSLKTDTHGNITVYYNNDYCIIQAEKNELFYTVLIFPSEYIHTVQCTILKT